MRSQKEWVQALSDALAVTKREAARLHAGFCAVVQAALARGEGVLIKDAVSLEVVTRAASVGKNPKTGEEFPVPARRKVRAKTSGRLAAILNGKESA